MLKLTAPKFEDYLQCFKEGYLDPSAPSEKITEAMDPLFDTVKELAPLSHNNEAKAIWVTVPRGDISDYGSFEEWKTGDDDTYEDFASWYHVDFPNDPMWYKLILVESEIMDFRAVAVGRRTIINADFKNGYGNEGWTDDTAVELCKILTGLAKNSMEMLRDGIYNEYVEKNLPYQFRKGVVARKDIIAAYPEMKENIFEGLSDEVYEKFKKYAEEDKGVDPDTWDGDKLIQGFTGNDFLRACAIGYKACRYEGTDLPLVDQYFLHGDGRDEGLTGRGHGLNEGPGIDLDDPEAWTAWFMDKNRFGGHPWEVCRGGNSTHVSLFVRRPKEHYEFLYRAEQITKEELDKIPEGYYFQVAGNAWNRAVEAVNFYVALKDAGLPVVFSDTEEILARFEATDNVGIVPHDTATRHCEDLFPGKYGKMLDFMHVFEEEMEKFRDKIEWLPEEPAKLLTHQAATAYQESYTQR